MEDWSKYRHPTRDEITESIRKLLESAEVDDRLFIHCKIILFCILCHCDQSDKATQCDFFEQILDTAVIRRTMKVMNSTARTRVSNDINALFSSSLDNIRLNRI